MLCTSIVCYASVLLFTDVCETSLLRNMKETVTNLGVGIPSHVMFAVVEHVNKPTCYCIADRYCGEISKQVHVVDVVHVVWV